MGLLDFWNPDKRDHHKFEALLRPHVGQLYRLAYRYTGHQDDAEDLVQDLLLKLYPRLHEIERIDHLASWLAKSLYRLFVDRYRRQQRSPLDQFEDMEPIYATHASETAGPDEQANRQVTRGVLEQALAQLKVEQRVLILLHDAEDYSLKEISDITDLPIGTIKSRLSRGRHKLREIIQKMEPESGSNVLTDDTEKNYALRRS